MHKKIIKVLSYGKKYVYNQKNNKNYMIVNRKLVFNTASKSILIFWMLVYYHKLNINLLKYNLAFKNICTTIL